MNRRKFIETSGAAAGAAMLGKVSMNAATTENQQAGKPSVPGKIKIGLYSITYGGIWYVGPALTFDEFCKKARETGFDGVELDNKRPMGNPMDLDQRKRDEIGYNGYFTYELCHSVLNEDHTRGGLEFVHNQVRLAREYMAGILGSKA